MFLKKKVTGAFKARGCADGRQQREFISKDESSSLTVSTYALFISCAMDDEFQIRLQIPLAASPKQYVN